MSLFYVGHPRETDLALFAGGELGPISRWRIEKHLQSCEPCRTAVADFFHLQGDLEELSELPSSVDWAGMSLRIRKAVAEAGETQSDPVRGHFFPKPSAWQLGLATAAIICGFIVVRQFPLPEAEDAVITATDEQNAVSREARTLEGGGSLAPGGSAAPSESFSTPSSRDAVSETGGRAANIPAPSAPTGPLGAQRKDAAMNLALDRRVTGLGILREELDQPIGGKKKASADKLRRAKASSAPAERQPVSQEEQFAKLSASSAMQIAGVGASIAPPTDGSEIVVDVKTDGGVRFRRVDAATGRITITDVYSQ